MNIEDARKVIKNIKLEGCKECVFDNDTGCINENGEDCQEIAIETLLTAYEKEKEKNKKIDEFCRKELAFERRLKRENRELDEFNQGRFYVSENIRKITEGE